MTKTSNDQAKRIAVLASRTGRQSQRICCAPDLQEVAERLIPRSRERGPVEAFISLKLFTRTKLIPRSRERGPVEANCNAYRWAGVIMIPRSRERGRLWSRLGRRAALPYFLIASLNPFDAARLFP